jgi:uroporphyrinogen-III decarboxylase
MHPQRLADTIDEIDALIPLPNGADPRALPDDGRHDLARALLDEFGASHFPMGFVAAPLWRTYDVWGFEGMMTMIATRPDLARHACNRLLTEALWIVREAAARGCAGVWIEDCMTDMIHPDDFALLNLPFVRAITDEIRACGMKSVHYFCGNPAGKWSHLLDAGADALSLEESKKGFAIDIDEVVERVNGQCAVLGNLDAIGVLEQATPERLRAEIARQVAAGRRNGSRFVMSLGSPVTPGTRVARVRLYCDLARDIGARRSG